MPQYGWAPNSRINCLVKESKDFGILGPSSKWEKVPMSSTHTPIETERNYHLFKQNTERLPDLESIGGNTCSTKPWRSWRVFSATLWQHLLPVINIDYSLWAWWTIPHRDAFGANGAALMKSPPTSDSQPWSFPIGMPLAWFVLPRSDPFGGSSQNEQEISLTL